MRTATAMSSAMNSQRRIAIGMRLSRADPMIAPTMAPAAMKAAAM